MSAFSRPPAPGLPKPTSPQQNMSRPPQVPTGNSLGGSQRVNPFANRVKPGLLGQQQARSGFPSPQSPQQRGAGFGQKPGNDSGSRFPTNKFGNNFPSKNGFPSAGKSGNASPGINYGDDKYINDLKTLEQFYEDNRFTKILEQRYEDFKISPDMPRIVYPKDELYAQLKYYDDIKSNERLNEKQLMQIQEKINFVIKQINYIDNYEFYKQHHHDVMAYNQFFEIDNYKDIRWYQRTDDIKTSSGAFVDYIDISIPKEKWWLTQVNDEAAKNNSSYVYNIQNPDYPNELLNHPMFRSLNEYASFKDLPSDPILIDYPDSNRYAKEEGMQAGANTKNKLLGFLNRNKEMESSNSFPKRNNPQGPSPSGGGFPQRGGNTPGQGGNVTPTGFPQKNVPKPGGFGNNH